MADPVVDELVARVVASPDDDGPRLVLADHLIERGDPWGELIVLSCRNAELPDPALHERVLALRATRWPLDSFVGTFRRGFYDMVWAKDAGVRDVFGPEHALLRDLRVKRLTEAGLAALATSSVTAHVDELSLEGNRALRFPSKLQIEALAPARPHKLRLATLSTTREVVVAMQTDRLRKLELGPVSGALDGMAWSPLEALQIELMEDGQVAALLAARELHDLRTLRLVSDGRDRDAMLLAATPFRRLVGLDLGWARLGDAGIEALVSAPGFRGLERIVLGIGDWDAVPVTALSQLAAFTALRELELELNGVAPGTLGELYGAIVGPLRRLAVSGHETSELPDFTQPAFRELHEVDLRSHRLSHDALQRIADSPLLRLQKLTLGWSNIDADGARLLAASTTLPRELELRLWGNEVEAAGDVLRARFRDVSL